MSDEEGALAGYGFKGGLLTSASFDNGSVTYSYDRAGRITALNNSVGTASRGYAYEYDRAGNQTKKTETGNGEDKVTEYAYDSLNRLSEVTEDDGTRTEYSFDAWGNIAEKAYHHPSDYVFESGDVSISGVTEHTVSYVYDEANRLLSETESVTGSADFSGVRTYAYDDAGNLTGRTTSGDYGAKSESYVYDAFGKLIKYLENGEEKASYKYNGSGQRVEKTVNGAKTKYYWDGANIKNEGTASSVNVTNYFGANGVFARKSGSVTNVLYKNGHGDTVLLTNGSTVVRDYDYDAYGKEKGISSADENPFRYSGEYFDSETSFIYLRNRYYDPSSARFISEDPIRDGYNWYAYCGGNPITKIDPWGLYGERYVITESDPLNMRSGAGTDYAVIGTLERGTKVTFTGTKTDEAIDGHVWAYVKYGDKEGWVAAEYLGTADPSGKVKRSAPIIDRPEPGYYLPKGKEREEVWSIVSSIFLGGAMDASDPPPIYMPADIDYQYSEEKDENKKKDEENEIWYHNMNEATQGSNPDANRQYMNNMVGGKK